MKRFILGLFACLILTPALVRAADWLTDLPKAQARAKAENKMVLLNFTASDWSGWCTKFKTEVLDTAAFQEYAEKNLVMVEVDFPRKKSVPPELKKANEALKKNFKAEEFPTFVVLNKDGAEIGRQERYAAGGANAFIAKLEGFKKKN